MFVITILNPLKFVLLDILLIQEFKKLKIYIFELSLRATIDQDAKRIGKLRYFDKMRRKHYFKRKFKVEI